MNGLRELLERLFVTPAPHPVRQHARLLVLDTLGCALSALDEPKLRALRSMLGDCDLGALLAIAACWNEACEGLARAHGRPGVPVIAACTTHTLLHESSLAQFLDAVITGYEIGGRMGEALRMRPGMHVDASWPALGAAAAVARLAGGSAVTAHDAIEIAACQVPFSIYLPVEQGADARNTYLGHATWLGGYAAYAALAGCVAPRGAVARFAELALGLPPPDLPSPEGYVTSEAYLKRFAAVRHVHYGAEAALRLRPQLGHLERIDAIRLSIYPEAVAYCANRAPRTPLQAQFSLSFGIAAALRFGRLDADLYTVPAFDDGELRRLEVLVAVTADPAERTRAATLGIRYDGRWIEERISALTPLTETECRAKFMANARRIGASAAERIAQGLLEGPESQSMKLLLAAFK